MKTQLLHQRITHMIFIFIFSIVPIKNSYAIYATEMTQLLNHAELIASVAKQAQMVVNQIQMIQNQIEMFKSIATFPQSEWGKTIQALQQLQQIVKQGQAMSYTLQNIEQVFKAKYPGYDPPVDYIQSYQDWSQTTLDSIAGSFAAAGLQSNQFQTEDATMKTIRNLSDSAEGQTQALQAANMIANEMVGQLQKLRQLNMSQIQAQNAYMAHQVNKEAADNAAAEEFFHEIPFTAGNTPGY